MPNYQVFKRCNSASKVTTLNQDLTEDRESGLRESAVRRKKTITKTRNLKSTKCLGQIFVVSSFRDFVMKKRTSNIQRPTSKFELLLTTRGDPDTRNLKPTKHQTQNPEHESKVTTFDQDLTERGRRQRTENG